VDKTKRAVVFTRGKKATEQKLLCYFYASDNNINVLFDTQDIDEVADCEECEIMLVANASRISRDTFEYHRTVKALKTRGIEVVFTSTAENSERLINLLMKDLYEKQVK
jgi:hypothetical protein